MILLATLWLATQTEDPAQFDKILGVAKPQTLWVQPGESWLWPTPVNKARMKYAMWRSPEGQSNLLELPDNGGKMKVVEGVAMAAADYAPVALPDGKTLEATEQWIIRSYVGKGRPQPSSIVTNKTGLRTEIRLFMDPTAYPLGGDIALKLYAEGGVSSEDADEGEAYDGDFTITPPSGPTRTMHTGPQGLSAFRLDQYGVWAVRFSSVHDNIVRSDTLWFEARAFREAK